MRLHELEVTAFGPFAATVRVDLDALADAGVFLLHGPTGAGKTSVLDAVCFALYGVVPGQRQKPARLRSDHADPATRTAVRLELTVCGRRLRVIRHPAWVRPKRRGSGTTTEPARAAVEERSGAPGTDWTVLSTRNDEVGHLLHELLGMSSAQFCQVVLLPQGHFADFLRADAEARRPLLERLFDTSRFSAVEDWLVQRRLETGRQVAQGRASIDELAARAGEAARGLDGTAPVAMRPSSTSDAPAWLAALQALAAARTRATARGLASAQHELDLARGSEEHARHLVDLQRRHARALARSEALEALAPRRRTLALLLDGAARAAPVGGLLTVLEQALRSHERAAEAAARAAGAAAADATAGEPPGRRPARTAEQARAQGAFLREEVSRLDAAGRDEQRAVDLVREQRALAVAVVRDEDDLGSARAALAAVEETERALRMAVREAEPAATSVELLTAGVEALAARHRCALERDRLALLVGIADGAVREAVDAALQARQDWLDLRQARLESMASELAAKLVVGDGCPVCGSAVHPSPAVGTRSALAGAEAEEAAEQAHVERETEREVAEATAAALRQQLCGARARAGGDDGVGLLGAELTDARTRLSGARAAAAACARDRAALAAAGPQRERLAACVHELALAAARGRAQRQALLGQLAGLDEALARARGGEASVAARQASLRRRADLLASLADARERQERAAEAVEQARRCADEAALRAGFADAEPAREALRAAEDAGGAPALRSEADVYAAEEAAVAELLADPAPAAAAARPAPDLDALRARHVACARRWEQACAAAAQARTATSSLEEHRTALDRQLARSGPLEREHALVDGLSRLAEGTSGDNARRMRLSAYVLAARLEQVAAAATERLLLMSGGRYSLVHTDEGGGRGRAGLGLRVVDDWTGQQRETATLSGGESFFASLALALGLADVVAAEAGGAALQTLFIDEGFGSLDEQALDDVMDVLDGLRAGGRCVGVVSHVADLRQRIPAQLRIVKGRSGSTVSASLT